MAQGEETERTVTETDDRDMQDGGLGSATQGDGGAPGGATVTDTATGSAAGQPAPASAENLDDGEIVPS